MSSPETQNSLRLAFGVQNGPKDAPAKLLRMLETEQQAIAVSIAFSGFKLAYVGACLGKSESYVSLLRAGKRPMPEKLVAPFCAATGTNLLRQFRDLQAALSETDARREVERLAALLEAAAA